MPVKLNTNDVLEHSEVIEFTEEHILETSETAFIDDTAPEEEWDCEDGKINLGDGQRYLLINPIIV